MLQHYGWRTTFAVIGFTALLWLIPWLLVTPRNMHVPAPKEAERVEPTPEEARSQARRYRDLFGICLGFFCFDYYWFLLLTWLPDYLVTVRHLTLLKAGIFSALPFMVFGLSQPLGGWLGDRLVRAGYRETLVQRDSFRHRFLPGCC